jgi:hypothetical protein
MKAIAPGCLVLLLSSVAAAQDPDPSATAAPRSAEPIADGTSEFNKLDVDRDGWLTRSEVQVHPRPTPPFAAMDRDADGKLSSAEWRERERDLAGPDDD